MKQKLKQSKGITLISLVVTIIVLIILAGISLYLVLGENGLIEKAKETKPIVDITSAQEKLELVKGPVQLEKYSVNLDDYLEELEKVKEKYEVDDVERIDNDNAEIIIGGKYKFIATDEKNGNVKITYQGEVGGLEISPTSGTITYPTAGTFTVTKNTSGGALSVTSSDTNVATASINGTTVTITPKAISANGKKTTITVTSAATSNYEAQTKTYTVTVNMGTITLSADAYTGKYDGKDHNAVSNVKVTPADATLTYSLNGGTFSSTIQKVNGATTYTVVVKATKAGYADKTLTKTITIGKNTETGNLVLSANSGTITYPTAGKFTVTKNTSGGALSVTSSDTNVATASINGTTVTITPKAISANGKKTTITVTSAATSNYEAQTKTYTVTVNMGTITLSADAYEGNYDGKDHDAVSNVKVTPADATLTYSLNGGTFSSTIPKVNGATTCTVVVKATKAGYATKTLTKTITVGKNTETENLVLSASSGTITYPTAGTFTVTKNTSGGALSVTSSDTNVATATISGTTVTITPKAISADGKKTTITVTSAATSNYEAQTKTYTATVNMGTITLSADAYTGNYDGKDHYAVSNVKVTPSDATLTYSLNGGTFSSTIPKINDLGEYSIIIKASKPGYTTKTLTKNITINLTTYILKAGDYIKYDTGVSSVGTNGVVTCRVLYDTSSQYGLQIITDKNITNVTLGGSSWATGSVSYNNAITILNNEAGKYLNKAYATDARCVGSVPTLENKTFINKNSETTTNVKMSFIPTGWSTNDSGCRGSDTNYITDITQMGNINIRKTGENYWIASRIVDSNSSNYYFDIFFFMASNSLHGERFMWCK